jgi:subtilisin family serine protease
MPFVVSRSSLPGRTGRGVRVAVVDSGIHDTHPHVHGISGGKAISLAGESSDDLVDRLGHGTAVAAAIRDHAPDVELLAVKVFDRTLATSGQALVEAILWSASQHVSLINLSLGTTNADHEVALAAASGTPRFADRSSWRLHLRRAADGCLGRSRGSSRWNWTGSASGTRA